MHLRRETMMNSLCNVELQRGRKERHCKRQKHSSCTKTNKVNDIDDIDVNAKPFSQDVHKATTVLWVCA